MTDPNKPDEPSNLEDDWASAMAEQSDTSGSAVEDDPWAAAMAEQAATSAEADPWAAALAEQAVAPAPAAAQNAGDSVFKPLNKGAPSGNMRDLEMVMNIPVKLTVELGRTRITIKQLLELAQGSVIELEGLAGEPMDILKRLPDRPGRGGGGRRQVRHPDHRDHHPLRARAKLNR